MNVTSTLAAYSCLAMRQDIPVHIAVHARQHLLDSIAAMISGTRLPAGFAAVRYAQSRSGRGKASILGTELSTIPSDAALINGMTAHADETDDTHARSLTHPGSVVVPAALAAAECSGSTGTQLLRAVALGYDVCCRMGLALGSYDFHGRGFSTHAYAGVFGAAFAAGGLLGLTQLQFQYLASYAAQAASGIATWVRDSAHVEKAFDFAGMPARNGLQAALMVKEGFTGVTDVFDGEPNFLCILNPASSLGVLTDALGERFEVAHTTLKKWSVATPAQAPIDGLKSVIDEEGLNPAQIARVTTCISARSAMVVKDRDMPNVNIEHLLATLLVDGDLSYAVAHDVTRMRDPNVLQARRRVVVVPSMEMDEKSRHAAVKVELHDDRVFDRYVTDVRGTPGNPMSTAEVEYKALQLMVSVLDEESAKELIQMVSEIDSVNNLKLLRPLFTGRAKSVNIGDVRP